MYAPLITLTASGSLAPGLAVSWKYTDKALTTFQLSLRPGVKFSDGKPVTAADVIKSIDRAQDWARAVVGAYAALIKSDASRQSVDGRAAPDAAGSRHRGLVLTQRYLVWRHRGAERPGRSGLAGDDH